MRLWLGFAQSDASSDDSDASSGDSGDSEEAKKRAYRQAVNRLTRATALPFVSLMQAAHALEIAGDSQQAGQLYQQAMRAGGLRHLGFALAYGGFLHRQSDIAQAKKIYEYYDLAYVKHPAIEAARQVLAGVAPPLKRDPMLGLAVLFQTLGEAMLHEKRNQLGLAYTHIAHYLDASNPQIIYQIALLHERQKNLGRGGKNGMRVSLKMRFYLCAPNSNALIC